MTLEKYVSVDQNGNRAMVSKIRGKYKQKIHKLLHTSVLVDYFIMWLMKDKTRELKNNRRVSRE